MIGKHIWEFDAARFTCDGPLIISEFHNGRTRADDFREYIGLEWQWWLAHQYGYGNDYLRYFQEHDFIHHWIAQELGYGFSRSLRYGVTLDEAAKIEQENENDPSLQFSGYPQHIRHEENMVHWCQIALRTDATWKGHPEAHLCSGEFLWAHEGRQDHADILARLKDDITEFFGTWDLYPNVDPKELFERRWEWKN